MRDSEISSLSACNIHAIGDACGMIEWLALIQESRRNRFLFFFLCLVIETGVALIHTSLPYYTNLILLYAFPIIGASWILGMRYGLTLAFFSTAIWWVSQTSNRPEEVAETVHIWNACSRTIIFFGIVLLISFLKEALTARERTLARLLARRSFLASVSHEMREPLKRILAGSEILSTTARDPAAVIAVQAATQELMELVDAILELARLESGAVSFRADFNPVIVLREVVEHLTPVARQRNQMFSVEIDGNVPPVVRADQNCLRYSITRLLRDASEFSESGAIIITLGYSRKDQLLRLTVRDSGQANADQTNTSVRDGLGMHVAREMARLNGGRLWQDENKTSEAIHHFTMIVDAV